MERFCGWWKVKSGYTMERRYITLVKSLLLGLLPIVCCLVYCGVQGRSLREVYLPASEWNDELFYYKQVEGIVNYGFPQGYFGFNESHALKLSFAAWSPVLVFPWILWGLLFGWNMMSPILCNIMLMTLCCVLFVWLVRPTWKQLGILTLLFCLYTPFVRYMLSVMPEVICFSMLIIFYALAVNYLQREKSYKLAMLFGLSGVMTLMRPYLLLFMLLPAWFWFRRSRWKGAAGSAAVIGAVLGIYVCIKHYFGAEYFAPLFFTDWITAFFDQGLVGGIRHLGGKLYYMGKDFLGHTLQGFRTGLASGAFFAGSLVCTCVLTVQSIKDLFRIRRQKAGAAGDGGAGREPETGAAGGTDAGREPEADTAGRTDAEREPEADAEGRTDPEQELKTGTEKAASPGQGAAERWRAGFVQIEAHLAFSFIAMFFALLLMYKLTEGSKHLLTFMAAAVFVISLMETKFYKKAVLIGVTYAYFYSYMAVNPYDYQVPFVQEERMAAVEEWQGRLKESIALQRQGTPNYDNVVIWVFQDKVDGTAVNTNWQLLYALPEGFGISCCMPEYVTEHFDELESRYLVVAAGGGIDEMCRRAGYEKIAESEGTVFYRRPAAR